MSVTTAPNDPARRRHGRRLLHPVGAAAPAVHGHGRERVRRARDSGASGGVVGVCRRACPAAGRTAMPPK